MSEIRYATDNDINAIRRTLKSSLPPDSVSWDYFHHQATHILETDLKLLFKQKFDGSPDFDPLLMRSGYTLKSTDTTSVAVSDRVLIDQEHAAGGIAGHIYMRTGLALNETDLNTVNFTSDGWQMIENQMRYAASYLTLSLIYEYLTTDRPEPDGFNRQAVEYRTKYKEELEKQFQLGLDYDWDESGTIDSSDSAPSLVLNTLTTTPVW